MRFNKTRTHRRYTLQSLFNIPELGLSENHLSLRIKLDSTIFSDYQPIIVWLVTRSERLWSYVALSPSNLTSWCPILLNRAVNLRTQTHGNHDPSIRKKTTASRFINRLVNRMTKTPENTTLTVLTSQPILTKGTNMLRKSQYNCWI